MAVAEWTPTAERRRAELLVAAARLMERDGSEAVSMQALAREAGVSVGLIYRYFSGKDQLLLDVITNVLDALAAEVPPAVAAAGEDPVRGLAAAFRAYCGVIDEHRHAAVLTYRETKHLDARSRAMLKDLELSTSEPLRRLIREAVAHGAFRDVDVDLVSYNMLLVAHGWALKHWFFERHGSFEEYVSEQRAMLLNALLVPRRRRAYADLLD